MTRSNAEQQRMRLPEASCMYELKPGIYEVVHYPECEFGELVTPKLERMEFETQEEARLYAASMGYEWEKRPVRAGLLMAQEETVWL